MGHTCRYQVAQQFVLVVVVRWGGMVVVGGWLDGVVGGWLGGVVGEW